MAPRSFGKQQVRAQPEGKVRRSQMIMAYGPGALVDLVDQAVLIGGVDFWSYDREKGFPVIVEPRLRDALDEKLRAAGIQLSHEEAFREPPVGDDSDPSKYVGTSVLEFPQWFVCQREQCRALVRGRDGLELKGGRHYHGCVDTRKGSETAPVRFVAACKRGHVEDFPWIAFVHMVGKKAICAAPGLSLHEGASGDFSEIEVRCTCGARGDLKAATAGLELTCSGHRPWLGNQGGEQCEEPLRLLVRTASNSYFAQVVSALSVPEPGHELEEAIRGCWGVLQIATPETLGTLRQVPTVAAALVGYSDSDVLAAVAAVKKGAPVARLPIRTAEFKQITASEPERPGDLPPTEAFFFARSVTPAGGLPAGVAKLVLAHKLREVRAQLGFTRIEPVTPDLQGEFDLGVQSARLGLTATWLPATEVKGEGVFVELDESAVQRWEQRPEVQERARQLSAGYEKWAESASKAPPFPGVRFYMLHSFAHLLVSAISLECGYSASAIRERIYCGPSGADPTPMAAILLSTGSTGTEGTLGGLVEEGRRLIDHLQQAYDMGRLCSNDPVCASHDPEGDPAERFLEGAACHGCLFIAECSCERFNRYLDRALVVPTVGRPRDLAFFSERPAKLRA